MSGNTVNLFMLASGARGIAEEGLGLINSFREGLNAAKLAELAGTLRNAAKGKGNFGLGSGTAEEAEQLGEAWVGNGFRTAADGKTLVISDGLRVYLPPSFKPRLGKTQANFEQKMTLGSQPISNGHLDTR